MTISQSKKEYLRRIYQVQDHIEAHLSETLDLEELAAVAGFSKFHFHRIFKALIGESLFQYVTRLKLEHAANMLMHRPDMTITEIGHYLGFTDSAIFSRAFKNYYQQSPTAYRNQKSKKCKADTKKSIYNRGVPKQTDKKPPQSPLGKVSIVSLAEMQVAYVRYIGTYEQLSQVYPSLIHQLFQQAQAQQLLIEGETKLLCMYHDHHDFTEDYQLRSSLCITLPNDAVLQTDSDLGKMVISGGKYAVGHFELFPYEYRQAWDYLYGEWLPNSGYQPSDTAPFEMYLNDPSTHPENKHLVAIYFPIAAL
ncbi:AraC family transcriptional regulator [Isobaculum melis]|uniref:Transcriptional regulator, AraC family n=1 Tax=Isobaculum melis TaxID=142588 RepID=A0A1H9QVL0_9LACT|nr:GyrI-like domain-containing protein [Isobaculum melis]SER63869.1 transcriptional regulator, AraC family [Isobaculum melis]